MILKNIFKFVKRIHKVNKKMEYSYSEKYRIRNYEADFKGLLKISSIFNYFQEVASNHAEALGWGFDSMYENGVLWVLSRLQIEIKKLPKWGEEIEVLTQPRGIKKLFAVRDFAIRNSAGEDIIYGYSGWLVIDAKTFRLKNPNSILGDAPWRDNPEDMALSTDKLISFERKIKDYTRKVFVNDMDVNQHTNNAHYAEWLVDCFSEEFLAENTVKKITVTFANQTKAGDELQISLFGDESGLKFYLEAINTLTNQKVVQAEFEWK